MTSYRFDSIAIDRQSMFVVMSPLVGCVLGFFMTLAKTPPMILRDSAYGAFLGLLGSIAFLLFEMSLVSKTLRQQPQTPIQNEQEEETEEEKVHLQRIMAQLNELGQDRQRLLKARLTKQLNGPISMRTRSQTASLQ